MAPCLFVVGTDTGVGKTTVACALLAAWRAQDRRVAALKPAESGCAPGADGRLTPADAIALAAAAGHPHHVACPHRYARPVAPAVAARRDGPPFDLAAVHTARGALPAHDLLVVEGAGGLLVPFADDLTGADVARALGARVLVVARAGLGTINHTALTVEAARRRSLEVLGVVLSHGTREGDASTEDNAGEIARVAQVRVLGELAHGAAVPSLDLDALWRDAIAPTAAAHAGPRYS